MTEDHSCTNRYPNLLNKLFAALLVLFPASIPYSPKLSGALIILLLLVWLLLGRAKRLGHALRNKYVVLFMLFFVIPLIALFYSEHKDFSLLEKRMTFLLCPLMLFTSEIKKQTIRQILQGYSFSCTIAAGYILACAIYKQEPFTTEMAIKYIGTNHVYLSLFISFAIVISSCFLLLKERHDYLSLLVLVQIIFLLFFQFVLGGKMSIISLLLLFLIACLTFIARKRQWIFGVVSLLVPLALFFITLANFEVTKERFSHLLNPENYFVGNNAWNSIGVRLSILTCACEIYLDNPILGTGLGDVESDLNNCYAQKEFTTLTDMNPHNQYFQFLLGTGVLGLLHFLTILIYTGKKAYHAKNTLYLCFIFLFSFCGLTESLLERQQGVMFFTFFTSLLFLTEKSSFETGN